MLIYRLKGITQLLQRKYRAMTHLGIACKLVRITDGVAPVR